MCSGSGEERSKRLIEQFAAKYPFDGAIAANGGDISNSYSASTGGCCGTDSPLEKDAVPDTVDERWYRRLSALVADGGDLPDDVYWEWFRRTHPPFVQLESEEGPSETPKEEAIIMDWCRHGPCRGTGCTCSGARDYKGTEPLGVEYQGTFLPITEPVEGYKGGGFGGDNEEEAIRRANGDIMEVNHYIPYLSTPKRHPASERFHDILGEWGDLHDRKQADYGSGDDPFANLRQSKLFGVEPWRAALIRLCDKISRLQTYAQTGTLANEGVVDSFDDIGVYAAICRVLWEDEHA